MVPHDAGGLSEEDSDLLALLEYDDTGFTKDERTTSTTSRTIFGDELDIKPEVDTGTVSESCFSFRKLWKYTGPGWLMSIAYLDPGNLESDLQTGAVAGTKLLWLLFWSHVIGLIFQLLSARLGTITGKHLAQLIRQSYTTRLTVVLWAFAQIAIIGADILEIVGTAVALHILLRLPLWAGVLMTATDTFTFMMIQRYGIRRLEAFFMVLIAVMAICFWVELVQSNPNVKEILHGVLVPIIPKNAEFQAVAMLGAVVMPHNMFLHSALVMSRDLGKQPSIRKLKEANFYFAIESILALSVIIIIIILKYILLTNAIVFYKPDQLGPIKLPGLDDADIGLSGTLGSAAKYLWAAGLLAAGQSSTMTSTLAGQFVTEGFFGDIFKKDWHRVAATRSISLVPGMLVAIFAVDHFDTMGELLNVLQRPSKLLQIICWILTLVVISFDIFLFVKHATDILTSVIIGVTGTIYIAFLIYLVWKPLQETDNPLPEDGWMSLPQHEQSTRNHSDDEEIYAL
ncbi:hypothetical protein INT48_004510 [Thamnidium elegans]|uniref:Uncharacterized protein n=1 Tax=Thamnidium elegans TaxID=101142 RepID=A0A8H7VZY3_9FUNG|nr:hypothetical protein INT48_004510 [Thamnidium elegans]